MIESVKKTLAKVHSLLSTLRRTPPKSFFTNRKSTIITQIDFLIDTLNMNILDITYMESLKMPLSPDERIYFIQQLDRLNSSIRILTWMRVNAVSNDKFWTRLLRW